MSTPELCTERDKMDNKWSKLEIYRLFLEKGGQVRITTTRRDEMKLLRSTPEASGLRVSVLLEWHWTF